jgi:cell division protein FtsB
MKKKQRISQNLSMKFVVIFIILLIFMLGFITIKEILNKSKLDKEITELNQEIEQLKLKKQNFLSLIDTYQNDFYLEKEARSKMNLKKSGEKVVVVKLDDINRVQGTDEVDPTAESDLVAQQESKTYVVNWWEYFFAPREHQVTKDN